MRRLVFAALLIALLLAVPAQAGPPLLALVPGDVHSALIQVDDGADLHWYRRDLDGHICDHSRPAHSRPCGFDLSGFAEALAAVEVLAALGSAPPSLDLETWDGTWSPVVLAVELWTYDAARDAAQRWQVFVFALPHMDGQMAVRRVDRLDHFSWLRVSAADMRAALALLGETS